MTKKSDVKPQNVILGISLVLALVLGFIDIPVFPELIAWGVGFGTYFLLGTFK